MEKIMVYHPELGRFTYHGDIKDRKSIVPELFMSVYVKDMCDKHDQNNGSRGGVIVYLPEEEYDKIKEKL